jgi:hypothetical protein
LDNPDDDERTIINVKGVSAAAWNAARTAAKRQDEPMGVWLSKALIDRVNLEAGPRELPPLPPANPRPKTDNLSVEQLVALMQGMAELAKATGTNPAKADIRRAYGLADEHVREARGMPPRPVRIPGKAGGQSLALEGKASPAGPGIESAAILHDLESETADSEP